MTTKSIYTIGGTVQAGGGIYIERPADKELLEHCLASDFCYVLTARQMGKSSLMINVSKQLQQEGLRTLVIDLTDIGVKDLTAEQWYQGLMDEMVDKLCINLRLAEWWQEHAHLTPTQRFRRFFRKVVLEQVSEHVVVFVDEIDTTLSLGFADDFFAAIRAMYNARARDKDYYRLSFVLLGVAMPNDLIHDPKRTPFNIGHRIDLDYFNLENAMPLAKGFQLPKNKVREVMAWVLEWTNGHPYLTQSLCNELAKKKFSDISGKDIQNVVQKLFLGNKGFEDNNNLQFVRDMLTKRLPSGYEKDVVDTYLQVLQQNINVKNEEKSVAHLHLKLAGVVLRQNQRLVVSNRIYESVFNRDWIQRNLHEWVERIWVSPLGTPIPHQIPFPPADFVGRDQELSELLRAHEDGFHIMGVHGLGGVGKSVLAFALADKLSEQYPDGQIMVDMLGTSKMPLSTADAMHQVIRTWYPAARLPESINKLQNLYLSILHGKKIILLLDNTRSREQVEPLIPPKNCFLIITSRYHFTLPGHKSCDLDALSPQEAVELLLSIEPRINDYASTIASLCEYLPLALRVSASILADHPTFPVSEFLARFKDTQSRLSLTGMDASLQVTYDLLSPDLQEKLRFLSVFLAPFDRSAAAAIWAVDEEVAQPALDSLVIASLLDWDESTGFHQNDLLRDFVAANLTDVERKKAASHHAEYYLSVLNHANNLYMEGGDRLMEGLQILDANWAHIKQGQAWSSIQAKSDLTTARLCNEYALAMPHILDLRLHPEQQIVWLQAALVATHRIELTETEGIHLGNLGVAYANLGQVEQAIQHYQGALVIARKIGDRGGEGANLGNLGNAYRNLGQVEKAIDFYQQSLEIDQEIGDKWGEGARLGNLGAAYADLGQVEKAINYYQQALDSTREIGDRRGEGARLSNLGNAYADLGQVEKAIETYQQALEVAREIGDRRGEGARLGNLGNAYADLGQVEKAIEHYQQALVIAREIGDRRNEGAWLGNLGNAYRDLGQVDKAIETYQQALVIARETGDRRGEALTSWNLGLVYEKNGDIAGAIAAMQVCVDYEREIGHPDAEEDAARIARLKQGG